MGTDFFDDDLVREREAALKIPLDEAAAAPRDGHIPSSRERLSRPVGDLALTNLTRHKHEVAEQMVDKAQELDRLKARQEELERERRLLEELRTKQEAFDTGRRELRNRLGESLVRMEKQRQEADRLVQLLDETRRQFRERLEEVSALNENEWAEESLLDELNKALVLLESVRTDYHQSLAKIDAVQASPGRTGTAARSRAVVEPAVEEGRPRDFRYWLGAGLAFTLPLMVVLAVLAVVWMGLYFLA